MELSLDKIILFAGYLGLSALALIAILRGVGGGSSSTHLSRIKSRKEQRMLQAAISACGDLLDFDEMLRAIGKHAAETSGFRDWILFLRDGEGFRIAQSHLEDSEPDMTVLQASDDPRLYGWVQINSDSLKVGRHVPELAATDEMRRLLRKMVGGQIIPFRDLQRIHGFVIVANRLEHEKGADRSHQFYDLFSSFAAILIKNARLNQERAVMLQNHQRVETLASLGKLAAGLAHEIRNPLAFIKVSTQHLQKNNDFNDDDDEICTDIVDEIDRINQHVEDLLVLGRMEVDEFVSVDVEQLLEEVVRFTEKTADMSNVSIQLHCDGISHMVKGDAKLLRQLFMNIIINGMEAMPEGGELLIALRQSDNDLIVDIDDTGGGIDEEHQKNLFNPFYTTKEMGTGLGLSIGFNIARTHKGKLELLESSTAGSCFRITLPRVEKQNEEEVV